jgi:putative phosphoribosyl transferase
MTHRPPWSRDSSVLAGDRELHRHVAVPAQEPGIVVFGHSPGHHPGDAPIARILEARGIATVRVDVVAVARGRAGGANAAFGPLAEHLIETVDWIRRDVDLHDLPLGLFGSGLSTAATLIAAARRPAEVSAVVCCNGRPDLAGDDVASIRAPTLFVVGRYDQDSIELDRDVARRFLRSPTLSILDGARRILEDPAAAHEAAQQAAEWFLAHFAVAREAMSRRELGDPLC